MDLDKINISCLDFLEKFNEHVGPLLFYIGFSLSLLSTNYLWISESFPNGINLFFYYASLCGKGIICLRLLLMSVQHPRYIIACFVIGIFFFFILNHGGDTTLITTVLVLSASRGSDIRVVLRIFIVAALFHVFAALLFYELGWAEDIIRHRWGLVGHSFGMINPGTVAQKIMILVFLTLLLFKVNRFSVITVTCVIGALCIVGISLRLSESIGLLLLPLVYVILCRWTFSYRYLVFLPLGCFLISLVLAWWYEPSYGNSTFESRFSIPHLIYDRIGLGLFSQDCGLVGNREAWSNELQPLALDNMFLRIFLRDGVIVGVVTMVFLSYLMYYIGKIRKPLLASIAAVFIIEGLMEFLPAEIFKNFTLFYCLYAFEGLTLYCSRSIGIVGGLVMGFLLFYLYAPWGNRHAFSHPNGCLGDIDPPVGFDRILGNDSLFSSFIRSLPLAKLDTTLRYYDGTPNDSLQPYNYRLVDFPLLDQNEQCADVCMRIWAEYLYYNRRFFDISFTDTRQKRLHYLYGYSRNSFNQYIKEVYSWANTESLKHFMPVRSLKDIQPGDVFVYDKASRPSSRYGHAIFVADVAVNSINGQKAILLLQGSTPASDIHVIRNIANPEISPWFLLDSISTSYILDFGTAKYYPDELHYFE